MSREKKERRKREQETGQPDQLVLEAGIRKRYANNWPNVILELSKRVTGVNTRWQNVMANLRASGAEVRYSWHNDDGLTIRVCIDDEGEETTISHQECIEGQHYMEVLVMDVLDKSPLINKKLAELS
jgi:hypothetical protein